jgi:glycosyltransferase involved in cell wall biosynthesis
MRILCIASRLLGNATFATNLVRALRAVDDVTLELAYLEAGDYQRYKVSPLLRWSDPLHVHGIARQKFGHYEPRDYGALIVSAWDLLPALGRLSRSLPTALALDTTPAAAARVGGMKARDSVTRLRTGAKRLLHETRFRRAIRNVDVFLPMSDWCAASLHADYEVAKERQLVTWNPVDLDAWTPAVASPTGKAQLLFVGNDLKRKGIGKLLAMFTDHELGQACTLRVVSTDPMLSSITAPSGVELVGSLPPSDLRQLYRRSDLFVLPTTMDYSPNVLAEAAATGVPAIATDVGGVRSLVQDGTTGRLMAPEATAGEWATAIRELLGDQEQLAVWGKNARRLAEQRYSLERFDALIRSALALLHGARA